MKSPRLPLPLACSALAFVLLAGCEGPDRKAMMETAHHSIPPMSGNQTFFNGDILVDMTLSGAGGQRFKSDVDMEHDESMHVGVGKSMLGSTMGEGSFGTMTGAQGSFNPDVMEDPDEQKDNRNAGGRRGNRDGTYQGNRGMRGESEDEAQGPRQRRHDFEMPPAMIRFRLKNTTPATIIVEVRELNSNLGNFAVRPDTVTLEPGKAVEVEPMQSLLGVDAFTLPITISLRAGGETETKTLTLELVKPPTPAAEKPPSPAK